MLIKKNDLILISLLGENEKFISERTTGYKEFRKHIFENYKPQDVANITGIDLS